MSQKLSTSLLNFVGLTEWVGIDQIHAPLHAVPISGSEAARPSNLGNLNVPEDKALTVLRSVYARMYVVPENTRAVTKRGLSR